MRPLRIGLAGACTLAALLSLARAPCAEEAQTDPAAAEIRALTDAAVHPWLRWPRFPTYQGWMRKLYSPREYAPLWIDGGRPTAQAREAVASIAEAGAKGLDPADYDARLLAEKLRALGAGPRASAVELARFDAALSLVVMRYVSDLHIGRVNPKNVDFGLDVNPKKYDLAVRIGDAVAAGRIRESIAEAEPDLAVYRRLLDALARYQAIGADPGLAPPSIAPTVKAGGALPEAAALRRWLVAVGDLDAAAPHGDDARYDAELEEGVMRFQRRHGLDDDGVIGRATAAALAVPASVRVRQIQLTLERIRWIPPLGGERFVAVNIPSFELFAVDAGQQRPTLSMKVVVGKAMRTETPVFAGSIRYVEFAPYWNVPYSIARKEIYPKERARPGYLASEDMELVADGGVVPATAENIEGIANGSVRVRQRPGAKNALGRVKFIFPNSSDVYLHDTPARQVFSAHRRDFSHGCVRVEEPEAFANWLLAPEGWSPERVAAGLAATATERVTLSAPVPVFLFYATAVAWPDGRIGFFDDLYGHDAELQRALAGGEPYAP